MKLSHKMYILPNTLCHHCNAKTSYPQHVYFSVEGKINFLTFNGLRSNHETLTHWKIKLNNCQICIIVRVKIDKNGDKMFLIASDDINIYIY